MDNIIVVVTQGKGYLREGETDEIINVSISDWFCSDVFTLQNMSQLIVPSLYRAS